MNILTDNLPTSIAISGEKVQIPVDFKTWIRFTQLMLGGEDNKTKTVEMLKLLFKKLPPNLAAAVKEIKAFYNPVGIKTQENEDEHKSRIYDFDYDAELIYSAFLQQYGIDLCTADLHWWQFKALLGCLSEDTQFVKVMQYRSCDLAKIKDKQQKRFYRKMKRLYALPDNRSEEEKTAEFESGFVGQFI